MKEQHLEAQIDAFLAEKRPEIVAAIKELVAIPSISQKGGPAGAPYGPECAKALDVALAMGENLGFASKNYDYYCGSLKYEAGEEEIGLFAHLDVVPAGSNWSYQPFCAVEEDGHLIGRGTNDDKGPAVAALYAMACLKELGLPLTHSVRLVLGCEEEQSMTDMAHYIAAEPKKQVFSIVADGQFPVCYGEKGILTITARSKALTGGHIVGASGGIVSNMVPDRASLLLTGVDAALLLKELEGRDIEIRADYKTLLLTAHGKSTHAAWPEGSESAIYKLCATLAETTFLNEEERQALAAIASFTADYYGAGLGIAAEDECSGKLTHIAGLLSRTKAGELELNFNIRYPVTTKGEAFLEMAAKTLEGKGFSIVEHTLSEPGYVDPQLPIVQKMTDIYNRIAGDDAKPYTEGGATYARKLPYAVAYGPHFPKRQLPFGQGRGKEHMPDECVNIAQLLDAIKIYVLAILEIDRAF